MLRKITKNFLLQERLKVDAGASIQAIHDFMSAVKISNKRDTNRLQVAKEHLKTVKNHVRKLSEQVNTLEEQLRVLNEDK
jgi:DNA-binding transcriptional MerR regulator